MWPIRLTIIFPFSNQSSWFKTTHFTGIQTHVFLNDKRRLNKTLFSSKSELTDYLLPECWSFNFFDNFETDLSLLFNSGNSIFVRIYKNSICSNSKKIYFQMWMLELKLTKKLLYLKRFLSNIFFGRFLVSLNVNFY